MRSTVYLMFDKKNRAKQKLGLDAATSLLSHIFRPDTWERPTYPVHWQLERLHNSPTKPRTSFNTFRSASILLPVLFCSILILSLYPLGYFWSSVLDTVKDNASLLKMERFRSDHALLKTAYKKALKLCFGRMNMHCEVLIPGQEMEPECFVGPCHMTTEKRRDKDPLTNLKE